MECAFVWFKATFLLCFSMQVAFGQVTVSVSGTINSTETKNSSFFCTPSGNFNELRWRKSDKSVTSVGETSLILQYTPVLDDVQFDDSVDASHYQFDSDNNNELKILSVTLDDEANYWCDLTVGGQGNAVDFITTEVGVPPSTKNNKSSLIYGNQNFNHEANVVIGTGDSVQFTFIVFGLKPNATAVSWSVNPSPEGTDLNVETTYSRENAEDPRLGDTISIASLNTPATAQDLSLKCITSYSWAETTYDLEFSVTLQVQGGASSVLYRLDVILTCLAMTAAYLNNQDL